MLPTTPVLLQPEVAEHQHSKLLANQRCQAHYYNQGAKQLSCGVNVSRAQQTRVAESSCPVPNRSYEVAKEDGKTFRRNRVHLRNSPEIFVPVNKSSLLPEEESQSPSVLEPLQMEAPARSLPVMSSHHHHHHLTISLELRELETMYRRQDLADKLTTFSF